MLTGTPEGVLLGLPKEERIHLLPGDIATVAFQKLGSLRTRLWG
ncbi:hypothetical protein [Cohnella hashimotonis]